MGTTKLEVRSIPDIALPRRSSAKSGTQQEASLKSLYVPPIPTTCAFDGHARQRSELVALALAVFPVQVLTPRNVLL